MTTIVQALLLATTILLVLYFLTNRRKARAKAGVKLGFVLLVLLAIWAVLRPDDVTVVAQAVGVARGTDLMLYVLIMAFGHYQHGFGSESKNYDTHS